MRRFRRAILILALPLLAGCPTAGMHRPAVDFALATRPAAPAAGDTVWLAATVANRGDEPLVLEFARDCVVAFFVRAEDDQRVVEPGNGLWPCGPQPVTLRLAPGEERRFEHAWIAGVSGGPSPRAGAFTAYAVLEEHHLARGRRREFKADHRSNEVEVRVGER